MSLSEVQLEAAALSPEGRLKLAGSLAVMQMKESGEWAEATAPDAAEREGWISLAQARERLSKDH